MSHTTQQLVDQQLHKLGRYNPLLLLRHEGRLIDHDYDAWCSGDAPFLDDLLMGNLELIQDQLETAAEYAQQLGLQIESRPKQASNKASRNTRFNQLLLTAYQPANERLQLDLFMDTQSTTISNSIRQSIGRHQALKVAKDIEQLYEADPGYADLGAFEQLHSIIKQGEQPAQNAAEALLLLESHIIPLANETLGMHGQHFLEPLWTRLSKALSGHAFDPKQPKLHCSYAEAQKKAWPDTLRHIEAEPKWPHQAPLLLRHLHATTHLGQEHDAIVDYCLLCWHFPDLIDSVPQADLTSLLSSSIDDFQLIEPELAPDLFPAWLLLEQPGLCHSLPEQISSITREQQQLWHLMQGLQKADKRGAGITQFRSELRQLAPDLFDLYMCSI